MTTFLKVVRWLDVPLILCLLFIAGCLSETGMYRRVDDNGEVVASEGPVAASQVKSGNKYLPCLPDGTPIKGEKPVPWTYIAAAYLTARGLGTVASFLPPPWNTVATAILGGSGFNQRAGVNTPPLPLTGSTASTPSS
jgi:hypothetical protein